MKNFIKALATVLLISFIFVGCGTNNAAKDKGEKDKPALSDSSSKDTESKVGTREMYIKNLKKSEVFKQYSPDDWRSHAYDYKLVAFTFDDGPSSTTADSNCLEVRIVNTLKKYDGKGTFFVIGKNLVKNGYEVPKYAIDNGFEIGNHSFDHIGLNGVDYRDSKHQIVDVNDMLKEKFNVTTKYFRGASFTAGEEMWKVLDEENMVAINRSVGVSDYPGGNATVDSIVESLSPEKVIDGAIICMHSTNPSGVTPDALAIALPTLYEQGYRFCTVSELFAFKGVDYEDIPNNHYIRKVWINEKGVIEFK